MRLTAPEKREVIRLVEDSDLSARRMLRQLGVHRSTFYGWYRRYTRAGPAGLAPRTVGRAPALESHPPARPRAGGRGGVGRSREIPPRARLAVHGSGGPLSLGIQRVSHPPRRGPDHESGLRGALGGQDLRASDASAQRTLANRLHVPAGRRLGLVLPVDGARRLLALHPRVDAADVKAGVGCHRDARPRPGPGRRGPRAGRPSAAPAQR